MSHILSFIIGLLATFFISAVTHEAALILALGKIARQADWIRIYKKQSSDWEEMSEIATQALHDINEQLDKE